MIPFFFFFFFLALLLLFLPLPSLSLIPLNSTLLPSSSAWSSPNNTFSLHFINHSRHPDLLLLAITPSSSPSTPVWSATELPLSPSSSSLSLLPNGNLVLLNSSSSSSNQPIWQSSTADLNVTSALLKDTGDLVLLNSTSTSAAVWSSFSHPSDTLLQSQPLTPSLSLRSGPYTFRLLSSGNLTLQWNDSVTYFNKGLNSTLLPGNSSLSSPSLVLNDNGILVLKDPSLPNSATIAYSSDYGEGSSPLRFLRLDPDGNFRAYVSSSPGSPRWSAVADQCEVFGWCGNMGICSYNGTQPVCGCPSRNFERVNPSDPTQGCRRTADLRDCPGNVTMLQLNNTQFLTYPPDIVPEQFFMGISTCRSNCLSGSSCVASTSLADGSGLCNLKVSTFVCGYRSPALPSTSFVKVCAPGLPDDPAGGGAPTSTPPPAERSERPLWWVVALLVAGAVALLAAVEWWLWWCFCREGARFGRAAAGAQYALLEYASGAPVQLSYKELQRATKGFRDRLGAGGFGAVYKGTLPNNRNAVAVKQLEGIEQGERQFRMEVATISSTHHLNLVRLIGFCSEGRHRLLVYEFMKNGSLDGFLFSDESAGKLSWEARFRIALGTARGITYLHEECRDCIVHCDIKPENILLDDRCNAKVSDFGLAKLVNPKDHRFRTLTSVRGTRGYLAPEWLANLPITSKSDVYSFGMVLLEIVSGRRNFDVSEDTCRKKFSTWAFEEFDKGHVRNIVDRRLPWGEVDAGQADRAVQVSFWCIQEQPSQRPAMGKVVQMLEGILDIERPPAPKSVDGSMSITSGSASVSVLSTFAPSAQVASSLDSFQGTVGSMSISRKNLEKTSSSRPNQPTNRDALDTLASGYDMS